MKKKMLSIGMILGSVALTFPVSFIATSCNSANSNENNNTNDNSNNNNNNNNVDDNLNEKEEILVRINQQSNYYETETEYSINLEFTNLDKYADQFYVEWLSTNDNVVILNNNNKDSILIKSNYECSTTLSANVYRDSSKQEFLCYDEVNITFHKKKINYSFNLTTNNYTFFTGDVGTASIDVNPVNENLFYEWTVSNGLNIKDQSSGVNLTSIRFDTQNVGNYNISVKVYESSSKQSELWSGYTTVEYIASIHTPTDQELTLDTAFNGNGWIKGYEASFSSRYQDSSNAKKMINDYGVLNTLTLTTKMYYLNTMIYKKFKDTSFRLIKNDNYDHLIYEFSGTSSTNHENWGKQILVSDLIAGWNGLSLNENDNVKVVMEYKRSSISTISGINKFDENNLSYNYISGGESNYLQNREVEKNVPIEFLYTNDYVVKAKIYLNNELIKDTNYDNRTPYVFAYTAYNSYYNKYFHIFGDRLSTKA